MGNRNVDDICFFQRGSNFGKCIIVEVIMITDKNQTIVNYKIRLYGTDKIIQVHTDDLFDSFDDARNYLLKELKKSYIKQIDIIKNDKESKFDDWEEKYQNDKGLENLHDEIKDI